MILLLLLVATPSATSGLTSFKYRYVIMPMRI
jgi:hypothetical protein